jgi:hypothetical protein
LCNIFLVIMSTFNREQLILQVKEWIAQSGFTFESSPDSKYDFVLNFTEKDNLPQLQLIHQKPESAFFLIVSLVNIPKTDRDLLKKIDVGRFSGLIWDLKLSLLRMGVDFTVLGPDEFDPDAWEVQLRLFISKADASVFHELCSKVKRGLISIIWTYKRALDAGF